MSGSASYMISPLRLRGRHAAPMMASDISSGMAASYLKALVLALVRAVPVSTACLSDVTMVRRILWQVRNRRHTLVLLRQIWHSQIQQLRDDFALQAKHAELHCVDESALVWRPRQSAALQLEAQRDLGRVMILLGGMLVPKRLLDFARVNAGILRLLLRLCAADMLDGVACDAGDARDGV